MSRFSTFFIVLVSVLTLSAAYLGHRMISRSTWAAQNRWMVWVFFAGFILFQICGPIIYRGYSGRLRWVIVTQWITYGLLGAFACLLFYTLTTDLVLLLWRLVSQKELVPDLERRTFLGVITAVMSTAAIGTVQAIRGPRVYEIEIPIPNLPKELEGFRIAQISDLHVGQTIKHAYADRVAKLTQDLKPDLIALTGDMVDGSVEQLREDFAPIAELRAPHGVFFITGNHEYYWGADEWVAEHQKRGIRTLLDEHAVISHRGVPIVIAGITDPSSGESERTKKSVHGAPTGAFKILLAHRPQDYKEAAAEGFDLQLSGHTHGGQFFPWSILVSFAHRYYVGLNRHEKLWVYVNRGTGYWGPPNRFAIPSEITLLKLKRV